MNRNEEEVTKFTGEELSMPIFFSMDNKLLDAYYSYKENFSEDERDLLKEQEFLYYLRRIASDLNYLVSLKFTHFWATITKVPEVQMFLDEFLQNVRKHNDIYKIQFLEIPMD